MASRGVEAGQAFIKFFFDTKDAGKGLSKIQDRLRKVGMGLQKFGKIATLAGAAMVTAFVPAITAASDLQETMQKFDVVFGDNAEAVKMWGDEFADVMGRSRRQIAEFLSGAQDLFVPLGFSPERATELSKIITGLAIDLASFNNMADADTMRDLQAALTGSSEVMKKYGVIVNEAAVKQELLNQGLDPKIATNQQKVQARLNIILAGTTAAQGDAVRSGDQYANMLKRLRGVVEDTAGAIGMALLPAVTEVVEGLVEVSKSVRDWIEQNPGAVKAVAAFAAGVAALGATLTALGVTMAFLAAHPIVALVAALAGLAAAFASVDEAASLYLRTLKGILNTTLEILGLKVAEDYTAEIRAMEKATAAAAEATKDLSKAQQQMQETQEEAAMGPLTAEESAAAAIGLPLLPDTLTSFEQISAGFSKMMGEVRKRAIKGGQEATFGFEAQLRQGARAIGGAIVGFSTLGNELGEAAAAAFAGATDGTSAGIFNVRAIQSLLMPAADDGVEKNTKVAADGWRWLRRTATPFVMGS